MTAQSTPTFLCSVHKSREFYCWFATLMASGTWGGSTLSFYVSPDAGTTLIPIKDITDVAVSFTSNASLNIQMGVSRDNTDRPQIWCELASGSGASITVRVYDNN